jgi:hypothetical protein
MHDENEYAPGEDVNDGRFDYLPPLEHDQAAFGRIIPDEATDDAIIITAGELWDRYGLHDPDQILNGAQHLAVSEAVRRFREHVGDNADEDYDPEDERYDSPEGQLNQAIAAAIMTASTLVRTSALAAEPESVRAFAWLIAAMTGDPSAANREAVRAAITADDTADVPLAQAARDVLMPYACGECGTEADAPGREPDHFGWCSRAAGRWEVAFGPVDASVDAASAEQAATLAAAADEFERDSKYYQADPNPAVWVRRASSNGPWQQVYLDPGAIEAAVAAIRAREHGEDEPATAALVSEARAWIARCVWTDLPRGDVAGLTDEGVMRGIERHYDGGWRRFAQDSPELRGSFDTATPARFWP